MCALASCRTRGICDSSFCVVEFIKKLEKTSKEVVTMRLCECLLSKCIKLVMILRAKISRISWMVWWPQSLARTARAGSFSLLYRPSIVSHTSSEPFASSARC